MIPINKKAQIKNPNGNIDGILIGYCTENNVPNGFAYFYDTKNGDDLLVQTSTFPIEILEPDNDPEKILTTERLKTKIRYW